MEAKLPVGAGRLRQGWRLAGLALGEIAGVLREYLRLDWTIATVVIALGLLLLPNLPRTADNPQMLEAFVDDEVWQALALDGTLRWPYGNPANFLDPNSSAYREIPAYWGQVRYPGIFYYGGAMYAFAVPVYAGLRAIGFAPFPTVVIVLRTITVAAALLTLVFLYNFARRFGSRAAGIMAVLFIAADPYFVYYTVYIHPDQLQVLFGLVALALAIRHAERGDVASLVALGLACGFVQGTKLGGPWTIPMAGLALWWGMQAAGVGIAASGKTWRAEAARRVFRLAAASLAGWIVTTPYGFVGLYYFKRAAAQLLTQSPVAAEGPFGHITILSWISRLYEYMGPVAVVVCGLPIARILLRIGMAGRFRAYALTLVLCASQLAVYGSGKYWVVLGYLLLAAGLMAVLAFDTLIVMTRSAARIGFGWIGVRWQQTTAAKAAGVALAGSFVLLYAPYGLVAVLAVLDAQLYRSSTQTALNRWAVAHIPRDKLILFDAYAYFDPLRFTRVVRSPHPNWPKIAAYHPDYFVISSCIYDSDLYKGLIREQTRAVDDPYLFSVRVYQDLLKTQKLGPTDVPGVEYVAHIEPAGLPQTPPPRLSQLRLPGLGWAATKISVSEQLFDRAIAEAAAIWSPPQSPIVGCSFRVYHFDRQAAGQL